MKNKKLEKDDWDNFWGNDSAVASVFILILVTTMLYLATEYYWMPRYNLAMNTIAELKCPTMQYENAMYMSVLKINNTFYISTNKYATGFYNSTSGNITCQDIKTIQRINWYEEKVIGQELINVTLKQQDFTLEELGIIG